MSTLIDLGKVLCEVITKARTKSVSGKGMSVNCGRRDFFDEWTPASAYLLGLLYADGHLHRDYDCIYFRSIDRQLVDLFCRLIDYQGSITETVYKIKSGARTIYTITFGGPVVRQIEQMGLPRGKKAARLAWPPSLSGRIPSRDFVRGFFDGDGSAGWRRLSFTSQSLDLLLAIEFIARSLGCWPKVPRRNVRPLGWAYDLQYGDCVDVALLTAYMYLYPATDLCLVRKREKLFTSFLRESAQADVK